MSEKLRAIVKRLRNIGEDDIASELDGAISSMVMFPKKKGSSSREESLEEDETESESPSGVSDKETKIFGSLLRARIAERQNSDSGEEDSAGLGEIED